MREKKTSEKTRRKSATVLKVPKIGKLIAFRVALFDDRIPEVFGVVKSARIRKGSKLWDHGLYVELERVLYVVTNDENVSDDLKKNNLHFFVDNGKWRYADKSDVLGKVL